MLPVAPSVFHQEAKSFVLQFVVWSSRCAQLVRLQRVWRDVGDAANQTSNRGHKTLIVIWVPHYTVVHWIYLCKQSFLPFMIELGMPWVFALHSISWRDQIEHWVIDIVYSSWLVPIMFLTWTQLAAFVSKKLMSAGVSQIPLLMRWFKLVMGCCKNLATIRYSLIHESLHSRLDRKFRGIGWERSAPTSTPPKKKNVLEHNCTTWRTGRLQVTAALSATWTIMAKPTVSAMCQSAPCKGPV